MSTVADLAIIIGVIGIVYTIAMLVLSLFSSASDME